MKKSDIKSEILAPAGNVESLKAAVIGGADAVYLGLKDFSARAKAENFSLDELSDAVEYAHLYGVKVYVAVNTLIKDSELKSVISLIQRASEKGADAFIIQDIGLLYEIRNQVKGIPLHASTQMGIHNVYGAKLAKKLGFDRIVLSREATLNDIRRIHNEVNIETEVFVQGALCVAFSGNCLLSSLVSGYSGNRGKCMQLCRKKYTLSVNGKTDTGYYLSPKDLCLVSELRELSDAGVCSFKIEGRMRRAEYVAESVAVYRKALDAIINENKCDIKENIERLKGVFNRGDYCEGYLNDPTANIIYPSVQGHKGVFIGTVSSVENKAAVISTNKKISVGDGLKFIGRNGESGGAYVKNTNKITFVGSVIKGDKVYLTTDSKNIESIRMRERRIPISYKIVIKSRLKPRIYIRWDNGDACYTADFDAELAKNAPISRDDIIKIFSKSISPYFAPNVESVEIDENIFLTLSQLKQLRRNAEQAAFSGMLSGYTRKTADCDLKHDSIDDLIKQPFDFKRFLMFDSPEFSEVFGSSEFIDAFIYRPKNYSDFETLKTVFTRSRKPIFLDTPIMSRDKDNAVLEQIAAFEWVENIVAENLYAIELFKNKNILLGAGLNILNHVEKAQKIISFEAETISDSDYVTVFSKPVLMTFAHCPYKSLQGKCNGNCSAFNGTLTDEKNNTFKISHYKVNYCYARLENTRPFCIMEEAVKSNHKNCVFDFCGYSAEFAREFIDALDKGQLPIIEHTHFNYNKVLR